MNQHPFTFLFGALAIVQFALYSRFHAPANLIVGMLDVAVAIYWIKQEVS